MQVFRSKKAKSRPDSSEELKAKERLRQRALAGEGGLRLRQPAHEEGAGLRQQPEGGGAGKQEQAQAARQQTSPAAREEPPEPAGGPAEEAASKAQAGETERRIRPALQAKGPESDPLGNENPRNEKLNREESNKKEPDKPLSLPEQIKALEARLSNQNKERLYLQAEFENYKKRALREKSDLIRYGGEGFIRALAEEVLDDLERAFEGLDKNSDLKSFERGMRLIYKNIQKILGRFYITAHDPSGKPFDPRLHEALSRQPSSKAAENTVLSTFKKGYTLDGKLIRAAQVIVAAKAENKQKDPS